KELHAKGDIRIKGKQPHQGGAANEYTGSGGHAVYDAEENILFLKAEGEEFPEVQFGEYWIRDEVITLDRSTGLITAMGNKRKVGHTRLRPLQAKPGDDSQTPQDINITYGDRLSYDCNSGMARFVGGITLIHPRLSLQSKSLDVHTIVNAGKGLTAEGSAFQQVRRVVARKKVAIVTNEGRKANAEEATFDTTAGTLTLTGPPNPVIYEEGRFRINAPRIVSNSALDPGRSDTSFESVSTDGPGEMSILAIKGRKQSAGENGELGAWVNDVGTLISYMKEMRYDQTTHQATFGGSVVLTRGEVVLNSEQLEAHLSEVDLAPEKIQEAEGEKQEDDLLQNAGLKISRLIARQNAVMHSGGRHSKADRMIYDVDEERVTLIASDAEDAKIWDESGSQLEAKRIVRYNTEYTIDADGPGKLTLSENVPLSNVPRSARIHFGRRLLYTSPPDSPAKAEFIHGVLMRWQDMTIEGDRLETILSGGTSITKLLKRNENLGEDVEPGLLKRRIDSAVMTGNVKVVSGERVAIGDEAILLRNNDSVLLTGKPHAEMRDAEGVRLLAPRFELVRGLESKVTADGPGKLFIAAPAAERSLKLKSGGVWESREEDILPGQHPMDYRLSYQKNMVYNMTERRILFKEKVKIEQSTLFGRCDELEAFLSSDDSTRSRDPQSQQMTLSRAICTGDVYFESYEPPADDETLVEVLQNLEDNKSRPGTTALVECENAEYNVQKHRITFTGEQRDVRMLDQEVTKTRSGTQVERRYIHNLSKAVLTTTKPTHISFPFDKIFGRRAITEDFPTDIPLRLPPRGPENLTTTP
ncbi:MAG: hypothetical protein JXA52_02700, partial [Planctomycetes bacterium]|nr:hypothetical protein [Planctomycetota bacterium]